MEKITHCPICNSSEIKTLFKSPDKVSSGELFDICECTQCTFRFTGTRPTIEESGRYYQSDQYVSHTDDKKGIVLSLYRKVRQINLRWKVKIITGLKPNKGALLDYGCGLGSFLDHARKDGWNTTGMDISQQARDTVKKRYGINVYPNEELFKTPAHTYDVITLWHVLEHVYDLHETVEAFSKIIKPGGYILLALPNHLAKDATIYGSLWDAYDVPRHIWHFNKKSIQQLMQMHHFEHEKTLPMVFDAFYVSIRSEMHRNNKNHFLQGMFNGLRSHLSAQNTKEYSSQLYIFKRKNA